MKKHTHPHRISDWTKLPVLFSLYVAQSVPMSFFSTVVPVIMRQENYSLGSIGLLQLVKLPWIIKFLWAPLVDNYTRTKKQIRNWIIISELFYAAVILSIGLFDLQTDFRLIVILMVVAFTASATQDIATDIFAILILKKEERGIGNSMQSAGSFIGSLFGTGVLLIAYYYFGWTILLVILAACVVFAIIPLMLYKKPIAFPEIQQPRISIMEIFRFFNSGERARRLIMLVFFYSGIIGILAMLKPYLVDLGYNTKQIGFMSGIVGTSTAALMALVSGGILHFVTRRVAALIFMVVNIMAAAYFWMIAGGQPSTAAIYFGICLLWGAYGLSTVVIYTTSMDAVRPGREGTDFTLQIVITHLSSMLIAIFSGRVGDLLGYRGLFGTEALLGILTFFLVLFFVPIKSIRHVDKRKAD